MAKMVILMQFRVKSISEIDARTLLSWQYEPPYNFYNPNPEKLEKNVQAYLDPRHCCYSIVNEDEQLVGYCCFGSTTQTPGGDYDNEEALDIGFGLRPDLTGKGLGADFLNAILEFAKQEFEPTHFRLSVATFNKRAIRLYTKAGFGISHRFMTKTEPQSYEFIQMVREA